MGKIHSTIGESNFASQGQKRFVVDDQQGQLQMQDKAVLGEQIDPSVVAGMRRQAYEKQEQNEHRNLSDARRRVDIITGLGRRIKEVPIETEQGTVNFTLRTLKTFEQTCLSQVIEKSERLTMPDGRMVFAPTSLAKIRLEALAHSIFLIDGQSIDIVVGAANLPYDQQILARKDLIDEMDGILINHLYSKYEELVQETYDGYFPKNVEEIKEVVETISKSGQNS